MNTRKLPQAVSFAAGFALSLLGYAQTAPAEKPAAPSTPASTDVAAPSTASGESVVVLSPFTVTTDQDNGYLATNTTSGTRLNSAIKDLPMPIEVITRQFIDDIGARDLRQSLQYSAGIQLQTQNDWASQGAFGNTSVPGRINNPEGLTSTADASHVKIRGFDTEATLRDGFRRQNSTDEVNIDRVEVIRGPSALLYGVGNFGGVVNYLVRQPLSVAGTDITAEIGSYGLKRATIDVTGPVTSTLDYRLTGAWQDAKDYTQYAKENHYFLSPVVLWRPFKDTQILIDTEFGKQSRKGIGFQDLRAVPSGYVNDAAGYDGSFLQAPGINPKTFRWSGPDTYNDNKAYNLELKLTQKLAEGLFFTTGYDMSSFTYDQLDVAASLQGVSAGSAVPVWAQGLVTYNGLTVGQQGIPVGPQLATIGYQWAQSNENDKHYQLVSNLTYQKTLFEDSKWFRLNNTLVLGQSYTKERHYNGLYDTAYDRNNYHNPTDFTPIRYGTQPDGSPDAIMVPYVFQNDITTDAAFYAVYQGKLFDDRLTLIAGVRNDRSWNNDSLYSPQWNATMDGHNNNGPSALGWVLTPGAPSKDTTKQFGLNLRLTKDGSLSAYVMSAEAVEPNYSGEEDFNLNPLQASLGKDKEAGLKFDLFHGRLSGTVSRFQIDRTRVGIGTSGALWWAPTDSSQNLFNPNKDIVYNVTDLDPAGGTAGWVPTLQQVAPQWNAAVTAGAIYQATPSSGGTNWYVDASKPAGAAYLDALFSTAAANKDGYHGWMYGNDSLTNNASMDAQNNHGQVSVPLGHDRSTGWDGQIVISPMEDLQIVASWSHVEKKVISAAPYIKYPYPQDRWAIWYAPGWPALAPGVTAAQAYVNPADTSTYKVYGDGLPLDDTPRNMGSVWVHYHMPKTSGLKGLDFGAGATYEGPGALYPIYGRQEYDLNGNQIFLDTGSKTLVNAMVRYEFKVDAKPASIQLNVDNVANNTKYYGFIANPPRRWTVTYSQKL